MNLIDGYVRIVNFKHFIFKILICSYWVIAAWYFYSINNNIVENHQTALLVFTEIH